MENRDSFVETRRKLMEGIRQFRLGQDFLRPDGSTQTVQPVPIMVPNPCWYIRVHPGPASHRTLRLFRTPQYKYYPVHELPAAALGARAKRYTLVTAMNSLGLVFLWPISKPDEREPNRWQRTAWECAQIAMKQWVKVATNKKVYYPELARLNDLPEPVWPDEDVDALIRRAIDHVIMSADDAVLNEGGAG